MKKLLLMLLILLTGCIEENTNLNEEDVTKALNNLTENILIDENKSSNEIDKKIFLPNKGDKNTTLHWEIIGDDDVIDLVTGEIKRNKENKTVKLKVTISKGNISKQKEFTLTILKKEKIDSKDIGFKHSILDNKINLSWNKVLDNIEYSIFMKIEEENFNFIKSTKNNTIEIENLEYEKKYTFKIEYNGQDKYLEEFVNNIVVNKLNEKLDLKYKIENDKINFTWNKIKESKGYDIYIKYGDGNYNPYGTVTNENFSINLLASKTIISFKVEEKEKNIVEELKDIEVEGNEISKKIGLEHTITGKKIFLSWNNVENVTGFQILLKQKNGFYNVIAETQETNYEIELENPLLTYSIKLELKGSIKGYQEILDIQPEVTISDKINLVTTSIINDEINCKWNEIENTDSYDIFVKTNEEEYKLIKNTKQTTFVYKVDSINDIISIKIVLKGNIEGSSELKDLKIYSYTGKDIGITYKIESQNIVLNWNKIEGTDGYDIYIKENNDEFIKIAKVEEETYTYSPENLFSKYSVKINLPGFSIRGFGIIENITIFEEQNFEIKTINYNKDEESVEIDWEIDKEYDTYNIYELTTGDEFTKILETNENKANIKINNFGIEYIYKVSKIKTNEKNEILEEVFSTESKIFVEAKNDVIPPKNIKFELNEDNIFLSWDNVEKINEYIIFKSINSNELKEIHRTTTNNYTDKSIEKDNIYTYSIKSVSGVDESNFSEKIVINTYKNYDSTPCDLRIEKVTPNEVHLNWENILDVESYNIYRKEDGEDDFSKILNVKNNNVIDKNLTPEKEYSYYITAISENIESEKSNEVRTNTLINGEMNFDENIHFLSEDEVNKLLIESKKVPREGLDENGNKIVIDIYSLEILTTRKTKKFKINDRVISHNKFIDIGNILIITDLKKEDDKIFVEVEKAHIYDFLTTDIKKEVDIDLSKVHIPIKRSDNGLMIKRIKRGIGEDFELKIGIANGEIELPANKDSKLKFKFKPLEINVSLSKFKYNFLVDVKESKSRSTYSFKITPNFEVGFLLSAETKPVETTLKGMLISLPLGNIYLGSIVIPIGPIPILVDFNYNPEINVTFTGEGAVYLKADIPKYEYEIGFETNLANHKERKFISDFKESKEEESKKKGIPWFLKGEAKFAFSSKLSASTIGVCKVNAINDIYIAGEVLTDGSGYEASAKAGTELKAELEFNFFNFGKSKFSYSILDLSYKFFEAKTQQLKLNLKNNNELTWKKFEAFSALSNTFEINDYYLFAKMIETDDWAEMVLLEGETSYIFTQEDLKNYNIFKIVPKIDFNGINIKPVESNVVNISLAKPKITLLGEKTIVLDLNSEYKEPGATAIDQNNKDISEKIEIKGDDFDTSTSKIYFVTYSVTDELGNFASVERVVKVVDKNPILEIGGTLVEWEVGKLYIDKKPYAKDYENNNISSNIIVNGLPINTDSEGEFEIKYTVMDSKGRISNAKKIVKVIKPWKETDYEYNINEKPLLDELDFQKYYIKDKVGFLIEISDRIAFVRNDIYNEGAKYSVKMLYNDKEFKSFEQRGGVSYNLEISKFEFKSSGIPPQGKYKFRIEKTYKHDFFKYVKEVEVNIFDYYNGIIIDTKSKTDDNNLVNEYSYSSSGLFSKSEYYLTNEESFNLEIEDREIVDKKTKLSGDKATIKSYNKNDDLILQETFTKYTSEYYNDSSPYIEVEKTGEYTYKRNTYYKDGTIYVKDYYKNKVEAIERTGEIIKAYYPSGNYWYTKKVNNQGYDIEIDPLGNIIKNDSIDYHFSGSVLHEGRTTYFINKNKDYEYSYQDDYLYEYYANDILKRSKDGKNYSTYHSNGIISKEILNENDIPKISYFYPNGSIYRVDYLNNENNIDNYTSYYPNGKIKYKYDRNRENRYILKKSVNDITTESYSDEEVLTKYYPNSNIKERIKSELYKEYFYENGNIKEVYSSNIYKKYYPNGNMEVEVIKQNSSFYVKKYTETGDLYIEYDSIEELLPDAINSETENTEKKVYDCGYLISEKVKDELFKAYYLNGMLTESYRYDDDNVFKTSFYENGIKKEESDDLTEKEKRYYPNGNIMRDEKEKKYLENGNFYEGSEMTNSIDRKGLLSIYREIKQTYPDYIENENSEIISNENKIVAKKIDNLLFDEYIIYNKDENISLYFKYYNDETFVEELYYDDGIKAYESSFKGDEVYYEKFYYENGNISAEFSDEVGKKYYNDEAELLCQKYKDNDYYFRGKDLINLNRESYKHKNDKLVFINNKLIYKYEYLNKYKELYYKDTENLAFKNILDFTNSDYNYTEYYTNEGELLYKKDRNEEITYDEFGNESCHRYFSDGKTIEKEEYLKHNKLIYSFDNIGSITSSFGLKRGGKIVYNDISGNNVSTFLVDENGNAHEKIFLDSETMIYEVFYKLNENNFEEKYYSKESNLLCEIKFDTTKIDEYNNPEIFVKNYFEESGNISSEFNKYYVDNRQYFTYDIYNDEEKHLFTEYFTYGKNFVDYIRNKDYLKHEGSFSVDFRFNSYQVKREFYK